MTRADYPSPPHLLPELRRLRAPEPRPRPRPGNAVPGRLAFLSAHPEYGLTARLDELRAEEYAHLDADGHVYLDYAGAGLPTRAQSVRHAERLRAVRVGSVGLGASRSHADLIEQARSAVLRHFGASPEEYTVVFTAGATEACRLVGECYRFGPGGRFVHLLDGHQAVNGIRGFARAKGAEVRTVGLAGPELRGDEARLRALLERPAARPRLRRAHGGAGGGAGLFAYPAQSNFTGVRHPLEWVGLARERGFDVLLDAAASVSSRRLDLGAVAPDFVAVSWYKVFGPPAGLGSLVARRAALARLERPLAGVCEEDVPGPAALQGLLEGLRLLDEVDVDTVDLRVRCLTDRLLERLTSARHATGMPLVRVYGPDGAEGRGGIVTFNLLDPSGAVVDERIVARDAAAQRITLRVGDFHNPGAAAAALALDRDRLSARPAPAMVVDEVLDRLGPSPARAVRVSTGIVSDLTDVSRFVEFAVDTYLDRFPDRGGLLSRPGP
ncbi:aminotransferase class V-fold PLP-dependent enzyme [Marinactinospora endophytica]